MRGTDRLNVAITDFFVAPSEGDAWKVTNRRTTQWQIEASQGKLTGAVNPQVSRAGLFEADRF